jgi:hypothetical protein
MCSQPIHARSCVTKPSVHMSITGGRNSPAAREEREGGREGRQRGSSMEEGQQGSREGEEGGGNCACTYTYMYMYIDRLVHARVYVSGLILMTVTVIIIDVFMLIRYTCMFYRRISYIPKECHRHQFRTARISASALIMRTFPRARTRSVVS